MTVTLTYDSQLSRVRIDANGLGTAPVAQVERSTNQVTWTPVRGGVDVPVTAGAIATIDDYEFAADVPNYYRVTYPQAMSFVAAGTAAHANNASISPGLPAGLAQGDLMLMLVAIRNSGAGTPNTPTGWTLLVNASNMRVFGKVAGSSESAPTVTFAGGVVNADTSGQIAAFRGVGMNPVAVATNLNTSAQDIAVTSVNLDEAISLAMVLHLGWKQDDWTSVAVVADGTEIGEPDTTTGDDQGIVWDYRLITTFEFSTVNARTFVVTGGVAAISRGGVAVFEPNQLTQSNSITPVLDGVWLKFIARPFLNTPVQPWGNLRWIRRSRNGVFEIVGRSTRISLSDARLSREGELQLLTETVEDYERLDLVLSGGDPVFLHTPADSPLPTMYVDVGDVEMDSPVPGTYFFTLPLTQVAAPAAEVVGATSTFQTLVNNYASFSAVLSAFATFQDVLEEIAQPGDIEVP
jgi:hypothetical protein